MTLITCVHLIDNETLPPLYYGYENSSLILHLYNLLENVRFHKTVGLDCFKPLVGR